MVAADPDLSPDSLDPRMGWGRGLAQRIGRTKANMFELRDKSALTQGNSTKVHQKM
jgi:hypothetical protein